jgi:hypothetical protein
MRWFFLMKRDFILQMLLALEYTTLRIVVMCALLHNRRARFSAVLLSREKMMADES